MSDLGRNPAFAASPSSQSSLSRPDGLQSGVGREEFCARFKARMIARAGERFDDGGSIAEYADEAAPSYFEDPDQREDGPEECADADMSYWGDE